MSGSPDLSVLTGLRPRRRALLGAVGLVTFGALAGCRPDKTTSSRPPRLDPDIRLARTALASEQRVLDLAREVAARHPRLASRLAPTVAVHVRHVRVLTAALPAPSPAPSPSATPSTPTRGASMKELVAEERRLVALHRASALAARDGELAALLASMGAAAAQQETALR